MPDRIIEVHDGGASGAVTAITVLIIVLAMLAVFYFMGGFNRLFGPRDTKIDVNISKPSAVLVIPR